MTDFFKNPSNVVLNSFSLRTATEPRKASINRVRRNKNKDKIERKRMKISAELGQTTLKDFPAENLRMASKG